jgi:hypothetical protein
MLCPVSQKPPVIDADYEVITGPREAIEAPEAAQRALDRAWPVLKGWRLALAIVITTSICLPLFTAAYWLARTIGDPIGQAMVRALH